MLEVSGWFVSWIGVVVTCAGLIAWMTEIRHTATVSLTWWAPVVFLGRWFPRIIMPTLLGLLWWSLR